MNRETEIICNGPSMKNTILPGDKVETAQVLYEDLHRGDVIVYNDPENIRINIIHRVIGRDEKGLITRGDNNTHVDPYRVRPEHRPQKAVYIYRGKNRLKIKHSIFLHRVRLTQMYLRKLKSKTIFPIYTYIADTGIFYVFGLFLKTEIRKFKRPNGIEHQLFYGKQRIGIFDNKNQKWLIKFPWRLFVKKPDAPPCKLQRF